MEQSNVKKKKGELLNVTKEYSNVIWNCTIWGWNCQMWGKKKKWTTKCDKSTITCDVGTTQCEYGIVKCEKKKINHQMWQSTVTSEVGTA